MDKTNNSEREAFEAWAADYIPEFQRAQYSATDVEVNVRSTAYNAWHAARAALATAPEQVGEAIWCQACGDSITVHDPGICGCCYAVKYRDAAPPPASTNRLTVTPAMVKAAMPWLSNLHHMRKVDRESNVEEALRAALAIIAATEVK